MPNRTSPLCEKLKSRNNKAAVFGIIIILAILFISILIEFYPDVLTPYYSLLGWILFIAILIIAVIVIVTESIAKENNC